MKNMKISLLTLAFLSVSNFSAVSMEPEMESPKYSGTLSIKNDIETTIGENNKFDLYTKCYSTFDDSSDIHEFDSKIYVITGVTGKYQLESKRFSVTENSNVKVLCKVNVHVGLLYLGLLSTDRKNWHEGFHSLSKGQHIVRTFERSIPKGETITSLVFFSGGWEKNEKAVFTIEKLKILIN